MENCCCFAFVTLCSSSFLLVMIRRKNIHRREKKTNSLCHRSVDGILRAREHVTGKASELNRSHELAYHAAEKGSFPFLNRADLFLSFPHTHTLSLHCFEWCGVYPSVVHFQYQFKGWGRRCLWKCDQGTTQPDGSDMPFGGLCNSSNIQVGLLFPRWDIRPAELDCSCRDRLALRGWAGGAQKKTSPPLHHLLLCSC